MVYTIYTVYCIRNIELKTIIKYFVYWMDCVFCIIYTYIHIIRYLFGYMLTKYVNRNKNLQSCLLSPTTWAYNNSYSIYSVNNSNTKTETRKHANILYIICIYYSAIVWMPTKITIYNVYDDHGVWCIIYLYLKYYTHKTANPQQTDAAVIYLCTAVSHIVRHEKKNLMFNKPTWGTAVSYWIINGGHKYKKLYTRYMRLCIQPTNNLLTDELIW